MRWIVKVIAAFVGVFLVSASGNAKAPENVAVFVEADFPSNGPRDGAWYIEVLRGRGIRSEAVSLEKLSDPETASAYDALVLPTGGLIPLDGEEAIGRFLDLGKMVIVDGNILFSSWRPPAEVLAEASNLRKDFLTGKNINEYRDFLYRQGISALPSNLLRYDSTLGRWTTPISNFYYLEMMARPYSPEFHLDPWPNHRPQSVSDKYCRVWDEALSLNPSLAGTPWAARFPAQVMPSEERAQLMRAQLPNLGSKKVIEFANDVLLPLYFFSAPSGDKKSYVGFSQASKSAKDREGDFYIYRMNRPQRLGSTLLHFGVVGAELLREANGAEIFLSALDIASGALPGEHSRSYIESFNDALKAQSEFSTAALKAIDTLEKAATFFSDSGAQERSEQALKELSRTRRQYETISARSAELNSKVWDGEGEVAFRKLSKECRKLAEEISKSAGAWNEHLTLQEMGAPVVNPLGRYQLGFGKLVMPTNSRIQRLWPRLKACGFTFGPYYIYEANGFESLAKFPDLNTGYRLAHYPAESAFARTVIDGVLNPSSGTITERKVKVYDQPEQRESYEEDAAWFLKKANGMPGVGNVVYLSERDMEWSLWGEWMRSRFVDYLKEKYGDIGELNHTWGSQWGDFSDIALPTARPQTEEDHALWEDWTRFREVYYVQEEVEPFRKIAEKYAPDLRANVYGSYHLQPQHPANGINYYEVFKNFSPSTLEMGPQRSREILSADITSRGGRNITSEWSGMYFPPGFVPDRTDLLKREMWRGAGWGQLGIQIFSGASQAAPGFYDGNLIDLHENLLPNAVQIGNVAADFKRVAPLLLDGERATAAIRILYSPTTRRHTSWPGVAADLPMNEAVAWYGALGSLHLPARVLDEGEFLERDPDFQVLVVSGVSYLNDAVLERIKRFVRGGGTLVISPDSGRYNEYGKPKDSLLSLAGVLPVSTDAEGVVTPDAGSLSLSPQVERRTLTPLFPEKAKVLARYVNGEAAAVSTPSGKGAIITLGFPLGHGWEEWQDQPSALLSLLGGVMDTIGVERRFACDDPNLAIWPWRYHGKEYVIVTFAGSPKMEKAAPREGGFPFRRSALMKPFKLKVKGRVLARNVILGSQLPSTFADGLTEFTSLIASPGGIVLELRPDSSPSAAPEAVVSNKASAEVETTSFTQAPQDTPDRAPVSSALPFKGKLFAADGTAEFGPYRVSLQARTDGEWAGSVIMTVEHNGETIAKKVEPGTTGTFAFLTGRVVVKTQTAVAFMPAHWTGEIREDKPNTEAGAQVCRAFEEDYFGRKSVVLENGFVRLRVLPSLGGRIIEFASADGGANHLFTNEALLKKGTATSWEPYGGIHYNPGAFPGEFWNLQFKYSIERSDDQVSVRLERSSPVSWDYGKRGAGRASIAQEITLHKNASKADITVDLYNESALDAKMKLRVHGLFSVSGLGDAIVLPRKPQSETIPFGEIRRVAPKGKAIAASANWASISRGEMQQALVKSFQDDTLGEILFSSPSAGGVALEGTTREFPIAAGEKQSIKYSLHLLRGLGGVSEFHHGTGVWLDAVNANAEEAGLRGAVAASASEEVAIKVKRSSGGEVFELLEKSLTLTPDAPFRFSESLDLARLPDGRHQFDIRITSQDGTVVSASTAIHRQIEETKHRREDLQAIRERVTSALADAKSQAVKESAAAALISIAYAEAALNAQNEPEFQKYRDRAEVILKTLESPSL